MLRLELKTADGERIAAVHHTRGRSQAVILAHGFFNNKDVHLFRKMTENLAEHYDTFAFDFRGHGKSTGLFAWTSRECADLHAVVDYAKTQGYASIGVMGFSLGAAVSILEAAQNPDIAAVIAVSAPYDFWQIDYHFWEPGMWDDLKLNLGYKGRGKGICPGNPFEPKVMPVSVVERIAPRPVLFLHGGDDWLIKPRHSRMLFEKAGDPKEIVIIEGAGHAEKIFDDQPEVFMTTCLNWLDNNLTGRSRA